MTSRRTTRNNNGKWMLNRTSLTLPVLFMLSLTLGGCALLETGRSGVQSPETQRGEAQPDEDTGQDGEVSAALQPESTDVDEVVEPMIFPGSDQAVNMPSPREAVQLEGEAVTLNFEEAPLSEVVHAILGDILELDYVIEHPINGAVTLRTRSPIPRDQLLGILESLLQNNGALMVRDPNDRYFVSASPGMTTMLPGVSNPESEGAGYSNVVVPLEYVGAAEMADILRPVAPQSAFVRIDTARNLLVLAGTRNQINGWMDMINTFDVDQLAGMSVGIFPLENTAVEDINAALGELIGTNAEGENVSLGSMVRLIPLEQLNSLMVVSPRAHYIDQLRTWIDRLEEAQSSSGESTLHIFAVQNGSATHMAQMLSQVFGGGTGGGGAAQGRQDSGVAPGMTQQRSSGSSSGASMPDTGSNQGSGSANFDLGNNIRIVADEFNNALMVYAPRREFRKIESALEKLDIVPAQVLIEASILEVTLSDDLSFGVEWHLENSLNGGDNEGSALLNLGDSSNIGPRVPGFSYSITNSAGAMRAVINALAEQSRVNVISTPSIMVLDNHTAAIHVGDQQPVQSATIVTDGGNTTQSIDYKDTGVELEVTPSVNAGGMVTMNVLQSVTDVGPVDTATGQRSFLERNVSTRVAVRSGESVVLGGLIRDNASEGESGVPWLKDIPLVGTLFGRTVNSGSRTELLVFITPRVLTNEQDLRDISREMRNRMQGLQHFDDLPIQFDEPEAQ